MADGTMVSTVPNQRIDEITAEITALKSLLTDTDYRANKLIEGLVETMADATALNFVSKFIAWLSEAVAEYGETVQNRAAWRQRINELEQELDTLNGTECENTATQE